MIEPVSVLVPPSVVGVAATEPRTGATLVMVILAVAVLVSPKASVTSRPTVTVAGPSSAAAEKVGEMPVASSYWPSASKSQA